MANYSIFATELFHSESNEDTELFNVSAATEAVDDVIA